MGGLFSGGGKKQAKAIKETAAAEAAADREAARGAQLTSETMLAQDRAARQAAELLSKPQGTPEVDLESLDDNDALIRGKYSSLNARGISGSPTPTTGGGTGGGISGEKKNRPKKSGLRI